MKGGEAESYEGVTVRYVPGRQAIMKIFDDGKEVEQVEMHSIPTKKDMHALMVSKGFQLKNKMEVERIPKEHADTESKLEAERQLKLKSHRLRISTALDEKHREISLARTTPTYPTMFGLYFLVTVAALFLSFGYRKRKRRLSSSVAAA